MNELFDQNYVAYLFSKINRVKLNSQSEVDPVGIIRLYADTRDIGIAALYYLSVKLNNKNVELSLDALSTTELKITFFVKSENLSFSTIITKYDYRFFLDFVEDVPYGDKIVYVTFLYFKPNMAEELIIINDPTLSNNPITHLMCQSYTYTIL